MEDNTRLQEELKFLKESLDADIISKEEYEQRKKQLEDSLYGPQKPVRGNNHKKEQRNDANVPDGAEKPAASEGQRQPENEAASEKDLADAKKSAVPETQETTFEPEDEPVPKVRNDSSREKAASKKKPSDKLIIIIAVLLLIAVVFFFSLSLLNAPSGEGVGKSNDIKSAPACNSDEECIKHGFVGSCINPGLIDAGCVFLEEPKVGMIVLNAEDCFSCDTSRVEGILKTWFPGIITTKLSIGSAEGKAIATSLGIKMLPSFVFNSSLMGSSSYPEYEGMFSMVNSTYILSPAASGANYYLSRKEIPARIDIYLVAGDQSTERAEANIRQFTGLFSGIDSQLHYVSADDAIVKGLGINTFPTYLVNNKVKFSGVLPPESIKANFCYMNDLPECKTKLSSSLL